MDLEVCQLGLIPYGRALAMQEQLLALRQGSRSVICSFFSNTRPSSRWEKG